jgi:hypothetical protein
MTNDENRMTKQIDGESKPTRRTIRAFIDILRFLVFRARFSGQKRRQREGAKKRSAQLTPQPKPIRIQF